MPSASSPTESTRGAIGDGVYSLEELRLYVSLQGAPEDGARVLDWLTDALNPVLHRPKAPDYSFSDLISLFVVRQLLRHGVPLYRIRDAERHLRDKWQTDRPFVNERIATDGRHVFVGEDVVGETPERIETASLGGQQAMLLPIRDDLTTVRYDDGRADRWLPAAFVVVDPEVQFGEPVVEGTRLPTATVAAAATRVGAAQAADRYGIAAEAAASAVAFEHRLDALRAAA